MKSIMLVSNNTWALLQFRGELISFFLNQDYNVELVSPGIEQSALEHPGLKKMNWNLDQKGMNLFRELKSFLFLRNIYKKSHSGIILQYTIKPSIYGSLARVGINNKKVISIITGLGFVFLSNSFKAKVGRFLYKVSLKFSDEVWFLNGDDKELFVQKGIIPIKKCFVLPGEGVNVEKFNFSPKRKSNPLKVLFFGRLLKDKGIMEFIEAAKVMKRGGEEIEFQILGKFWKDNPSSISEKQFEELKVSPYIKYLGETTDVKPFIAEADVICLPSYREGVPVSLLEAASMGKPLIASNVPGCKDVIENGENGYLFEPRSVQSLIESIKKMLIHNDEELLKLGENSRKMVVEKYSCEIVNNIILKKTKN